MARILDESFIVNSATAQILALLVVAIASIIWKFMWDRNQGGVLKRVPGKRSLGKLRRIQSDVEVITRPTISNRYSVNHDLDQSIYNIKIEKTPETFELVILPLFILLISIPVIRFVQDVYLTILTTFITVVMMYLANYIVWKYQCYVLMIIDSETVYFVNHFIFDRSIQALKLNEIGRIYSSDESRVIQIGYDGSKHSINDYMKTSLTFDESELHEIASELTKAIRAVREWNSKQIPVLL